jgi:hypothetical protein
MQKCCWRHTWAGTRRATLVVSPFNTTLAFQGKSNIGKVTEKPSAYPLRENDSRVARPPPASSIYTQIKMMHETMEVKGKMLISF